MVALAVALQLAPGQCSQKEQVRVEFLSSFLKFYPERP